MATSDLASRVQPEVVAVVDRRRGRAIKAILRSAESTLFPLASKDVAADFRRVVLEELNDLTEVVLQLVGSITAGNELNEHWLRLVEEMHSVLVGDAPMEP